MSMLIQQLSETSLTVNYQNNWFLSISDQSIKSWVRKCLPFEYHPRLEGVSDNAQRFSECEVQTGWD
jgi:hypothetical protein